MLVPEAEKVATYERIVHASVARVWENVHDWEHLPWLHRDTFAHVALRDAGRWGWRAEVAMRGASPADPLDVELRIDGSAARYHTRTLAGPGTGTDIVTAVEPMAERATRIRVEFHVPRVSAEHAGAVGEAFRRTYARLWDEDEAMMIRRQRCLDGELEGTSREVTVDGRVIRFRPQCPHLGGPLEEVPIEDGCVTCPWHGYRFDLGTGASADGRGLRLACQYADTADEPADP